MLSNFTLVTVSLIGAVATSAATLPSPSFATSTVKQPFAIIQEEPSKTKETATKEVAPENPKEKKLICKGCNTYESHALEFLQKKGITDKNALATIMGNIRQESTFIPNICDCGARTSYHGCTSGGYGLIQWTSSDRYRGLGVHATRIGSSASSIDTQLDYMFTEQQWKRIENHMKRPGKSINDYMRLAYSWIGWGHHGSRTYYAYDYARKMTFSNS